MKKVIKVFLLSIVILFVLYNVVWIYYYSKFTPFKNAIGETDRYGNCTTYSDDGNYAYSVFPPSYLRFNGNLSISPRRNISSTNITYVTLIIWPKFFEGYKIGVMMEVIENSKYDKDRNEYEVTSRRLQFEVDEKRNPLKDYEEVYWKEFENNQEFIESYCDMAYDKWGILNQS